MYYADYNHGLMKKDFSMKDIQNLIWVSSFVYLQMKEIGIAIVKGNNLYGQDLQSDKFCQEKWNVAYYTFSYLQVPSQRYQSLIVQNWSVICGVTWDKQCDKNYVYFKTEKHKVSGTLQSTIYTILILQYTENIVLSGLEVYSDDYKITRDILFLTWSEDVCRKAGDKIM